MKQEKIDQLKPELKSYLKKCNDLLKEHGLTGIEIHSIGFGLRGQCKCDKKIEEACWFEESKGVFKCRCVPKGDCLG